MRFLKNGPSIPDELLIARDEGRVVFFCGAGVSRARARLLDFFGLAENVIRTLGVTADSPACKILNEARDIHRRTGVDGLISVDRIFGLLERDFLIKDIEFAVAQALKPPPDVDISAHRTLLDLATTPEGKVRLVTTNFDRLFDTCDGSLQIWQPPHLPDPSQGDEINGIIYLHGCTNKDYSGAEKDGFILSSSEFGRAYLSDGWATAFFREIVDRYIVVFIGYAADDPPVLYLLEALNKRKGKLNGIYAFQSGVSGEVAGRWHHKGVKAIPYSDDGDHRVLWETLSCWAIRAKAPDEWHQSVISLAKKGPDVLQPHERGQVAHVVSTTQGVRMFHMGDPPPAEWLCVFDSSLRYAKPRHTGGFALHGPFVDPFELYGLDSDTAPMGVAPEDAIAKRDIPQGAWDAFAASRLDLQTPRESSFPAIRGHWAINMPSLPSRLDELGMWIGKVAGQPASVWWAANQIGIHPFVQHRIKHELEYSQKNISPVVRQAWRYLFEALEGNPNQFKRDVYELKSVIDKEGWSSAAIREYVVINRPYLKAKQNFWNGPKPPDVDETFQVKDLVELEVEYPDSHFDAQIPDEWLPIVTRELRKNLEYALVLERECGGYALRVINSIVPDNNADNYFGELPGLSKCVKSFTVLFERLIELDFSLAHQEFIAWPADDDTIFSRLRIWASGNKEFVSPKEFGQMINGLSEVAFWDNYHQRDLLLVLAKRWHELKKCTLMRIQKRIMKGPAKWNNEKAPEYKERKAWDSLNRIYWLANNECCFAFDFEAETSKLRKRAPKWKPEHAANAAESFDGRGGFVRTDTEHSSLVHESLSAVLPKAYELSGRRDDFLLRNDPFAGLATYFPVRAFSALSLATKQGDYPEWAWRTFLNSESRKKDIPKFSALIAERLSRYPDEAITGIIYPVSDWILNVSPKLAPLFQESFAKVISKLINIFRTQPLKSKSSIDRGRQEPEWATEALNAPVGKIAQALLYDPRIHGVKEVGDFPAQWLTYMEDLLSLPGDLHRHAIVMFSHHLNWFYAISPDWTEANLLSLLDGDDDDQAAFWSGFFWGATTPSLSLYMRMKHKFLALTKERIPSRRDNGRVLAGMILAGWGTKAEETEERLISNDEMRDVLLNATDDFRANILWQIRSWSVPKEIDTNNKWAELLPMFFEDVWPRQKSVKTPFISARLCDLVFSNTKIFPLIADIVLPLLTTVDQGHFMLPSLRKSEDNLAVLYPKKTLAILCAILPDDVGTWPYGIEEILQQIGEADSNLNSDQKLLELKRIWNAR